MSDDQMLALIFMFFTGALGFFALAPELPRKVRTLGVVWIAFWWLPSLSTLWIKGVFG